MMLGRTEILSLRVKENAFTDTCAKVDIFSRSFVPETNSAQRFNCAFILIFSGCEIN